MKWPLRFIFVRTITHTLILGSILYLLLAFAPIINAEVSYYTGKLRGVSYTLEEASGPSKPPGLSRDQARNQAPATFSSRYFAARLKRPPKEPIKISPKSTEFGIVIEKIGVNAPVVADVDSSSFEEYSRALRYGVAHAKGTSYPGQPGNTYIHGHSSLGFWQLGKYATVFTLLDKLEEGDRIVTFYKGKRFDYQVVRKEIFPGYDITPLARDYEEAFLTIQTCYPPGTTLNRLVVTARLIS